MYAKSARFYDAIYAWKDYADEADQLHTLSDVDHQPSRLVTDRINHLPTGLSRRIHHFICCDP